MKKSESRATAEELVCRRKPLKKFRSAYDLSTVHQVSRVHEYNDYKGFNEYLRVRPRTSSGNLIKNSQFFVVNRIDFACSE